MRNLKDMIPTSKEKIKMPDEEKQLDFENMEDDQILDELHENPKDFVNLIASQVRKDIERENEQKVEEDRFIRTYKDFAASNPDFEKMWESGELKAYMDAHPGHNALSAYLAISHESRIQKAVAQKLQEKGLGDSPLSDTRKHGETTRVLADRLRERRSAGGDKGLPTEPTGTGELFPTV